MSSYDNVRQQKVSDRRKESGYQTKRLYFFAKDLDRIKKIAEEMGYDGKLSDEEYSAVVRSCIAARYSKNTNKTVEEIDTKDKQYTYTLK
ncbi:hypothetical protein ACED51_04465 [Photobacterium swingsii]|uniref:hypothetical protein n=1 Tax=Photobacterium swingsii TaxID=680026 RepID=UPI00352BEF3E